MFFTQLQQTNQVNKALKGKVILKVLINKRIFIFGMIILELFDKQKFTESQWLPYVRGLLSFVFKSKSTLSINV